MSDFFHRDGHKAVMSNWTDEMTDESIQWQICDPSNDFILFSMFKSPSFSAALLLCNHVELKMMDFYFKLAKILIQSM